MEAGASRVAEPESQEAPSFLLLEVEPHENVVFFLICNKQVKGKQPEPHNFACPEPDIRIRISATLGARQAVHVSATFS
jgi:hypothetical protein